jgi:hypothetical protein
VKRGPHVRRLAIVPLLATLPRCTDDAGRDRDTLSPAPPAQATPSAPDSVSSDGWLAEATDALRRQLERASYTAEPGYVAGFRECEDDGGSDEPPTMLAVARARPLAQPPATIDPLQRRDDSVGKEAWISVEFASVAVMQPVESAGRGEKAYAITVQPRLDTLSVLIQDVRERKARWAVCMPTRLAPNGQLEFWSFAHASKRWMKPVRWDPPGGSWERITQLADSVAAAAPER